MPTPSRARRGSRSPPYVDCDAGFFFEADSLEALAARIESKYQRVPMPPQTLAATVARYNFIRRRRQGCRLRQAEAAPQNREAAVYAAWATPVIHDSRAGLRINARCQVIDMNGASDPRPLLRRRIDGGFSMHGLPRAICQGLIAEEMR